MPAYANPTLVLDKPLEAIQTGTEVFVVTADPGGVYSALAVISAGEFLFDFSAATIAADTATTGRELTIPEIQMGSVGKLTAGALNGYIVITNGVGEEILFQTPATGAQITDGAAVTIASFKITNPQAVVAP